MAATSVVNFDSVPNFKSGTGAGICPASRYRSLFDVSDGLRACRDVGELFRVLPYRLRTVLDFDYINVLLNLNSVNDACLYLLDRDGQLVLTPQREIPAEQHHLSLAFEQQQPAVVDKLDRNLRFSNSMRLLPGNMKSGCALPLTTAKRRLGAIFLGSDRPLAYSEEEVRFLSLLAERVAVAIDDTLIRGERHDQCPNDILHKENLALREEVASSSMFEEIVGSSEALDLVLAQVKRVAPNDVTVLITGESGTGKELIARAIHKRSHRASGPFIRVNFGAIPPALIASELFGYERGAFTGANQRHLGRFEVANRGTIFLDEIGDIPPETQIALLRVLQEREIERVGGNQPIPINVRVLAATNCDLRAAVNAGKFRLDLFYRLNVFPLRTPSLRERQEDIPLLVEYFIERYASKAGKQIRNIERKTLECLQAYDWPGNIRELQNVIERAVILCDDQTFSIDESWLQSETAAKSKVQVPLVATMVNQEREIIETAIEECRGRISGPSGAAGKLGMPRTTLESKIKSLGINKHRFRMHA